MLPIPCLLKYCLNINSVDCHNTKKIQFESISYKYLYIYRNNHVKAENKPAVHSRCILACMLYIENQQQTKKKQKQTRTHKPKQTNEKTQPTNPPPPTWKKNSNQQTNKKTPHTPSLKKPHQPKQTRIPATLPNQ